ncbi:hypothetical protein DPMN_068635 [Dreissena polymorpha]|uniref:Uncharacterized protein n=1 Tax=Dreissena polymorpha TaxID=45954 RepID=A0A9D4BWS5_DREPO|nr:hypothetical protein DPMN_068635 [Dreissena polymorpha]
MFSNGHGMSNLLNIRKKEDECCSKERCHGNSHVVGAVAELAVTVTGFSIARLRASVAKSSRRTGSNNNCKHKNYLKIDNPSPETLMGVIFYFTNV